jgi:hypothetical protein
MSTTSADYVEQTEGVATTRKSMTLCRVCDSRIATFFVNGINIAMILVGILVATIRGPMFFKALVGSFMIGLPGLVLSGLGLYGAKSFELWAMYLATAGFLVAFIMDIVLFNWIGLVVTLIVLVPHVILTYEIRSGIMTQQTYDTEEFLIPEVRNETSCD